MRWGSMEKFTDNTEAERERNAAGRTLFELYSFLPPDTKPLNWPKAKAIKAA